LGGFIKPEFMATIDKEFSKLCQKILLDGKEYENKNRGVKRLQIPSYTFRHDFKDGFPAITNKKLYWKGIVGELIWFLRGDNDVEYLNKNGITIWNKDAYNWHKKEYGEDALSETEFNKIGKGSVGANYSVQWRNFNGNTDQILDLLSGMKKDIMSSRLKVNAWNPSEVDLTALPPCHSEFQVIGVPLEDGKFGFELHWNQRSVDVFLGLPFNIASYGLLAKIIESITGYKALAIEGTLKCVHFYDNQYEAAKELLSRNTDSHPNCELEMDTIAGDLTPDEIFAQYSISNFKLVGYSSDREIKVDMLAPKI
jgi:thymidylate synthase